MRVIVKHPDARPRVEDIELGYRSIKAIIGDWFECAMTGPGVHVYCDEDGLRKGLPMNLVRPSDGSPIVGTVVVVGIDHVGDERGLSEGELALWLATLAVIGFDEADAWRAQAIADLGPFVHDADRAMYDRIAAKVGR